LSCFAPNLTPVCERCVPTHLFISILMFFIWSGNHKFYTQFLSTPTWITIIYNNPVNFIKIVNILLYVKTIKQKKKKQVMFFILHVKKMFGFFKANYKQIKLI
jgi:hypothetical protein